LWEKSADIYSFSFLAQALHFAFISQFEMQNLHNRFDLREDSKWVGREGHMAARKKTRHKEARLNLLLELSYLN
jgi:hypothetical protein